MSRQIVRKIFSDSRTALSISIFSVAGMVVSGHLTGQIYPGLLVFLFLGVIGLTTTIVYGQSVQAIICSSILLAVGFRVYSMYIPASLIGDDPNSNLIWMRGIINTASVGPISSGFYTDAPLYYVLGSSASIIFGIDPSKGVVIYSIIIGTILPLVAVSMTRSIGIENTRLLAVAALLAPVTTEAVRRSYWPIAQTHASVFWWLFLLVLVWHVKSPSKRFYSLLAFLTIAIAYTHKLPLPIIGGIFCILLILMRIDRISFDRFDSTDITNQWMGIISLIGVITVGQWLYASDLIDQIALRIGQFVVGIATLSAPAGDTGTFDPTAAVPARPGLLADIYQYPIGYSLYFERSHAIILLLASGLGWLAVYLLMKDTEHRSAVQVILAAAAVSVFLITLGQVSIGAMNPTRPLLLIEPVLVTLIIGLIWTLTSYLQPKQSKARTIIVYSFILLLAASQIFTASAAADYPNTPRYYLDEPELEGAEALCNYGEGEVHVDQEVEAFYQCGKFNRTSRSNSDPLYNAAIEPGEHETVLYRPSVEVYLGQYDRWRLTWNPATELPREYHTVYDNGAVTAYNAPERDLQT